MEIYLSEKLKSLRSDRGVSQEKLAQYLGVSFQAVSKWENGNTYPDITLLPEIARFFGVTVDELLQVEKTDERKLFNEYSEKSAEFFRLGNREGALALWQEAYKKMPNNIDVKEMLMSSYFDTDRTKYFDEFVGLATEIANGDASGREAPMYYKSQAVAQLARVYAEKGDEQKAEEWACKSVPLFNARELIFAQIYNGELLQQSAAFCVYWFLEELFYLAARIDGDDFFSDEYKKECFKTVAKVYETVYKGDMGFEQYQHLYNLYQGIAEHETDETSVCESLEKALGCCKKSETVKAHNLTQPLLVGWKVFSGAPGDGKMNLRLMKQTLSKTVYDKYRDKEWFVNLQSQVENS